jgi:hypothetical protein
VDAIETFAVDTLTVRIIPDHNTSGDGPREWDNLSTMVCFHRNYKLGDKHDFETPEDFREFAENKANGVAIILPLYLMDHSGISISTSDFGDRWDSGQVGWAYITRAKIQEEYSAKRISKKLLERVRGYIVSEVNVYDQFLRGEVYGYVIEDANGEHMDSCWGYYGLDDARSEARNAAEHIAKSIAEETAKMDMFVNNCFAL